MTRMLDDLVALFVLAVLLVLALVGVQPAREG